MVTRPGDDPRPHQGRSKGGLGKRLTIQRTTGTEDPYEAAKRSVTLFQQWQDENKAVLDLQEEQNKNSLGEYWERYFTSESRTRETQRNFKRWKREESLKWEASEYGIRHQPWASRSVDLITSQDFKDYFSLLERRARGSGGSNGSGMKGQQKTLINKLLALAEDYCSWACISKIPCDQQADQKGSASDSEAVGLIPGSSGGLVY